MKINLRKGGIMALITASCISAGCSDCDSPENKKTTDTDYETIEPTATNRDQTFSGEEMSALGADGIAFRIYQAAKTGRDVFEDNAKGNFNLSPASAVVCLTLVANSLDEPACSELVAELGFESIDELNAATEKLLSYLPADGLGVVIKLANSVWVNTAYPCNAGYIAMMRERFHSPVTPLNVADCDAALRIVNRWCEENTDGLIKKVLDYISPDCAVIWANALYFNGSWADKFDKSMTVDATFNGRDGATTVAMMHANKPYGYAAVGGMEMVNVPFNGMNYCLDIILDDAGELTNDTYATLLSESKPFEVELGLPRFEIETSANLNGIFTNIESILNKATFSTMGLPTDKQGAASKSIQKTAIKVNEEGTEAAAVTITDIDWAVGTPIEFDKVKVTFDRPFTYVIRETRNGIILFIGRVENL